jgi:hypothetical protein
MSAPEQRHLDRARAYFARVRKPSEGIFTDLTLAAEFAAVEREALERAAEIVDECNREGPYHAIGAAWRIRALAGSADITP